MARELFWVWYTGVWGTQNRKTRWGLGDSNRRLDSEQKDSRRLDSEQKDSQRLDSQGAGQQDRRLG